MMTQMHEEFMYIILNTSTGKYMGTHFTYWHENPTRAKTWKSIAHARTRMTHLRRRAESYQGRSVGGRPLEGYALEITSAARDCVIAKFRTTWFPEGTLV